ncbi:MAG: DUF6456 domain-containing protein [Pseudomonadota bacterium]
MSTSGSPPPGQHLAETKSVSRRRQRKDKKRAKKRDIDLPELRWRGQHGDDIVVEETMAAGQRRRRVETVLLLDRYHKRRLIDDQCYEAGIRFRSEWTSAGRQPSITARYEEAVSCGGVEDFSAGREAAYRRFRRAIAAVGPIANNEVVDVCLMDRPAGSEARMEIARRGLRVLAIHYGIAGPKPVAQKTA